MDTLIIWPDRPYWQPLLTPYTLKRTVNLLRTQMASGRARQRRISQSVPTIMTAEWVMPNRYRNDFIGFVDYGLFGGAVSFVMPVKVGAQLIDHQCRLISHPADNEKPDGMHTRFKAMIEIRNLYRTPNKQVVINELLPKTLDKFVAGTDIDIYYTESWQND